jgi:hypothetical protein
MFSPGNCWSGLILNLGGSEVQALQTKSYGVRPLGMASKEFKGKTCAYCRRERASEAKDVGGFNLNVVHRVCGRCGRAKTYRRDGLVARSIILCLCGTLRVGQATSAEDEETLQGKLAEMVAFIRLAAPCDGVVQVPPEYVTEALSLLMVVDPPISEQMIEAKEEVVKHDRAKLGLAKWCQLYAVKASEANTIGNLMLGLGR